MIISKKQLEVKKDDRGYLIELLKPEDVSRSFQGQVFITTAFPGKTKGNHYHKRKTEWYCVIKGNGKITIIENESGKKHEFDVTGDTPELVEIPPHTYHFIENTGEDEMMLLVYVNEVFDPSDTDTYYERPTV